MLHPMPHRWCWSKFRALTVVAVCWAASSVGSVERSGFAQEAKPRYDELSVHEALDVRGKARIPLTETTNRIRELQSEVNKILGGESPLAGQEARFDVYFQRYVLPQWTFVDRIENTEKTDKGESQHFNYFLTERKKFVSQYLMRTKIPAVHDHLVKITLAKLSEIADSAPETITEDGAKKQVPKNLHPAARYFAMLFIAELNQSELVSTGAPAPPVPLAAAVPVMVKAIQNQQQIDPVRVAAWMGVLRYLEWESRQNLQNPAASLIAKEKPEIEKLAIELVSTKEPPTNRTLDGHAWMQRRAMEVLAFLGTIQTDINLPPAIESLLDDPNMPISLRCSAAEALGQLNAPPSTKLNIPISAKKMAELAAYLGQRELKRLDDEKIFYEEKREWQRVAMAGAREAAGGVQGIEGGVRRPVDQDDQGLNNMANQGGGGAANKPALAIEPYKVTVLQRRLKSQMHSITLGLEGVKKDTVTGIVGMAKANPNPEVAKYAESIAKIVKSLRDMNEEISDFNALVKKLRSGTEELDRLAKAPPQAQAAGPAKPAAAGDEVPADAPKAAPAKNTVDEVPQ